MKNDLSLAGLHDKTVIVAAAHVTHLTVVDVLHYDVSSGSHIFLPQVLVLTIGSAWLVVISITSAFINALALLQWDCLRVRPTKFVAIGVVKHCAIIVLGTGYTAAHRPCILDQVPIRDGNGCLLIEDDIVQLVPR